MVMIKNDSNVVYLQFFPKCTEVVRFSSYVEFGFRVLERLTLTKTHFLSIERLSKKEKSLCNLDGLSKKEITEEDKKKAK